jgi:hypothetical protein
MTSRKSTGPREVVGDPGGTQVEAQLHAHHERLAQLALGRQGPVAAVEGHAFEQYEVLCHPIQYGSA